MATSRPGLQTRGTFGGSMGSLQWRVLVTSVTAGTLALGLTLLAADKDDWPQFRGLQAGVVADDADLPEVWSATQNVAWKTPMPGRGWSSPIVSGDHVFVTTVLSSEEA